MPVRRLWILLLLAGIFWMHGAQYVSTEPGLSPSAVAVADHGTSALSGAASIHGLLLAVGALPPAVTANPLLAVTGTPMPGDPPDHGVAGHAWSLCLAVLLAGLVALGGTAWARRVVPVVLRIDEPGPRLPMGWFRPPRPHELSCLCLLRI